ncbi:MAG: proteasome assembly chaperone family protein [Micrococcales bacterium]
MSLPPLFSQRTLIVSFEGWNDAGEAASSAVKHLVDLTEAEAVVSIDPEEYCEFHYARPQVYFDDDGERQIRWPATEFLVPSEELSAAKPQYANLNFLLGIEPAFRWRSFAAEVLEIIEDRNIQVVLFVGAMLSEVPHTRPVVVTASSQSEAVRNEIGVEKSDYEGPVGILTVVAQQLETIGIPCVSVWAQVPHYVHQAPSPKVTLAIIAEIEKLTGMQFDHGDLANEAFEWERGIDEIAESDEEMGNYIVQLEKDHEEKEAKQREMKQTEGTGEVLAEEFEKFLAENSKDEDN